MSDLDEQGFPVYPRNARMMTDKRQSDFDCWYYEGVEGITVVRTGGATSLIPRAVLLRYAERCAAWETTE